MKFDKLSIAMLSLGFSIPFIVIGFINKEGMIVSLAFLVFVLSAIYLINFYLEKRRQKPQAAAGKSGGNGWLVGLGILFLTGLWFMFNGDEQKIGTANSSVSSVTESRQQSLSDNLRSDNENLRIENDKLKVELDALKQKNNQSLLAETHKKQTDSEVAQPPKDTEISMQASKSATQPENSAYVDSGKLEGKVVSVSDGDTVTILLADNKKEKIRLNQIDAPESGQDFGNASKKNLSKLIAGKQITVATKERDKYGRMVGTIFIDNKDINLEQVKLGMAWVYTKYASDPAYFEAHDKAKSDTVGLWSQPDPIAPWDFRKGIRKQPKPEAKVEVETVALPAQQVGGFTCGSKRFCKDMDSCDEARFYLNSCGISRLDRDHDGVPCESLCN